ncbi:MAG: glutamine--fructose-6-phosphate transaminase (isomerizing) [Candidatus Omnitrophica bacterium]|jgi:glucosamine--fructose-6-phosphate aminotransferase (isomerizing)|nr:glutamine--fructose-6-phosphate transaminase (isomerizing) [Candidatus Omnitrophota bacterium]
MCGIVGYVGDRDAQTVILSGLKHLEYRGYDSCGLSVFLDRKKELSTRKLPGKIKDLENLLSSKPVQGKTGIGHCRWATHGAPNQVNAHPHFSCDNQISLVHNGIIENYAKLKEDLIREHHVFLSQTDTEVAVHLIEKYYTQGVLLEDAVKQAVGHLEGSFALVVISKREPGKIVGARLGSPLVIGAGKGEMFFASDISALLEYTKDVAFMEDQEIAVLTQDNFALSSFSGEVLHRQATKINWDVSQAQKQGWDHFMLKEINEQPAILENILAARISRGSQQVIFEELKIAPENLRNKDAIIIVACGTAYHAGLCGKYILEELCGIPVTVDVSSEFRYRNPIVGENNLVLSISQSGETADTLAAVREAKKKKAATLTICNVLGSTLVRESDGVIYTHAGPEIGVASTKAFTAQLLALYLLAFYLNSIRSGTISDKEKRLIKELKTCPTLQREILKQQKLIKNIASRHHNFGSFLFLGRTVNYPMALEGALKLKEISYIPAEGYAAGEMKHGPIALIDEYRAVVCIAPEARTHEKMISNIQEILARQGILIAIATEGDKKMPSLTKEIIYVPQVSEIFSPLVTAVPLQLLAYHVAVRRGCDVDQPRNLAKSVTVE